MNEMKCVHKDCEEKAQYVFMGKSLCKEHFEEQVKRARKLKERAEEVMARWGR